MPTVIQLIPDEANIAPVQDLKAHSDKKVQEAIEAAAMILQVAQKDIPETLEKLYRLTIVNATAFLDAMVLGKSEAEIECHAGISRATSRIYEEARRIAYERGYEEA
jgi:Xaa-Pro aminopeptidase